MFCFFLSVKAAKELNYKSNALSQILQCIREITYNAWFCNKMVHISVIKWCIVGYGTGALWGLCNRSIDYLNILFLVSKSKMVDIKKIMDREDLYHWNRNLILIHSKMKCTFLSTSGKTCIKDRIGPVRLTQQFFTVLQSSIPGIYPV